MLGFGLGQRALDLGQETRIAGETEDVVDAAGFAPGHQLVAREAGIRPQQDRDPWPARADLSNDPFDLLPGAGRGVDVGTPQLGGQQVTAAEDVQRQVAVTVVVAVEEAPFLVAVERVVRGIEIENDPLGRLRVRFQEQRDEQLLDRPRVVADLVVAVEGRGRCVLEPVQRAFAGERGTVGTPRFQFADQGRQHRVVAQLVMVDQILIPQRDAANALREHGFDAMLDQLLDAPISEAPRQAPHQADRPVRGAEQQRAGVGGHLPAVEGGHHLAPFNRFKSEQIAATLCWHRGPLLTGLNLCCRRVIADLKPRCTSWFEKYGLV